MDNKIVFGILCILFHPFGINCFLQGDNKTGIIRILLSVLTSWICGIIPIIYSVMGIVLGIKVLMMSDEEYAAAKGTLDIGFPKMNVQAK